MEFRWWNLLQVCRVLLIVWLQSQRTDLMPRQRMPGIFKASRSFNYRWYSDIILLFFFLANLREAHSAWDPSLHSSNPPLFSNIRAHRLPQIMSQIVHGALRAWAWCFQSSRIGILPDCVEVIAPTTISVSEKPDYFMSGKCLLIPLTAPRKEISSSQTGTLILSNLKEWTSNNFT